MPAKHLVIVESPGKIKKIQSFLGSDYLVSASVGHIRDLHSTRENRLGVDVDNGFKPVFAVDPGKRAVVARLKREKTGKSVILAADEDREGEAIAESLRDVLQLGGSYQRILFNEITRKAILHAVKNPSKINDDLVEAQLTRRILDRLVGFELSPLIKRIPELQDSGRHSLGTGRVQSVVVRLVAEREQSIRDFLSNLRELTFTGSGEFELKMLEQTFKMDTELCHANSRQPVTIEEAAEAEKCLKVLLAANWKIKALEWTNTVAKPSAPFTTSSLQQEASSRLGFSVKRTMTLAQKLYEAGHITYMRTDATVLSEPVLEECRNFVEQEYGADCHQQQQYQTRNASAQEAHEAVRPTQVALREPDGLDSDLQRLYRLIWARTVASQMQPARYFVGKVELVEESGSYLMSGRLKRLVSPGHLQVRDPDIKPEINKAECDQYRTLKPDDVDAKLLQAELAQQLRQPPSRFTEASLVKRLESLGIGRPSTYASIITRVQDHEYVETGDCPGQSVNLQTVSGEPDNLDQVKWTEKAAHLGRDAKKLRPTALGEVVNCFLGQHFGLIVDYKFTSNMETQLDAIANGKTTRVEVLNSFYEDFKVLARKYLDLKPPVQPQGIDLGPNKANTLKKWQELFLTTLNGTEYRVYLGKTRFGGALRLIESTMAEAESAKCKKAIFLDYRDKKAPTKETVDRLLKLSGHFKDAECDGDNEVGKGDMTGVFGDYRLRKGPYGYYLSGPDNKRVSVPGDVDPETLTQASVDTMVKRHGERNIQEVGEYKIRNGPHGPYIQAPPLGKAKKPRFIAIPDSYDPKTLSQDQINEIIQNNADKPKPKAKPKAKPKKAAGKKGK